MIARHVVTAGFLAAAAGAGLVAPAHATHPDCAAAIDNGVDVGIVHVWVCSEGIRPVGNGFTTATWINVSAGDTFVCLSRINIDPLDGNPVSWDPIGIGGTPVDVGNNASCS